ncbi:hypothetical protein HPB52_010921 [Rhipicephalus sanguineus]|uniref:DUF4371 domain-containing protein n=1 Tax=Rhipicephalus sanguineus TaxID=34632 RepID=A0A9D4Q669_RHISA|nr:hypothetical protein HPB52_010921 [Rhipicephalus sanguineus]
MGKQLKGSSYSLIVDESTDISTTKQLCIVVRFLNSAENKIATTLLDLVELSDGTAQKLHVTVMKTLDKHGLPKTCLGLCTDGANSMSGNHNSLFSRLREDNNELVLVKCAGHSLDLVASKSMEAIPSAVEHLVGETHSFFAHSSCRQGETERVVTESFGELAVRCSEGCMICGSWTILWVCWASCVVLSSGVPLAGRFGEAAELRIRPHKPMRAREKRQDAATPAKRRKLLHHACAMRANEKKGKKN